MRQILAGLLLAASSCVWGAPAPTSTEVQYLSGTDKDHRVDWKFMVNGGRKAGAWTNRAERAGDYWLFSGIYRPVWLEAKPPANLERLTVDAKHTGDFRAEVFTGGAVPDGARVSMQITTLDGKAVGKPVTAAVSEGMASLSGHIDKVLAWSAERPQRYQAHFKLLDGRRLVHEVSKTIGFRTIELRKNDGLYVNGVNMAVTRTILPSRQSKPGFRGTALAFRKY